MENLTSLAHHQFGSFMRGVNSGEETTLWGYFGYVSDYSQAFTNTLKDLFSNTVNCLNHPEILIRLLDPIVESNRRLFWFLFPKEAEDITISLYDPETYVIKEKEFLVTCSLLDGKCIPADSINVPPLLSDKNQTTVKSYGDTLPYQQERLLLDEEAQSKTQWWMVFSSIIIITILPTLIIFSTISLHKFLHPNMPNDIRIPKLALVVMLAFAFGGLVGDAFFHLFPEIFRVETSHHHFSNRCEGVTAPVSIILGILFFWVVEQLASSGNHYHSPSAEAIAAEESTSDFKRHRSKSVSRKRHDGSDPIVIKNPVSKSQKASSSNSFAFVQILSDLTHNFTDGLALSAAWSTGAGGGLELGLTTTMAILFHEIPHELGDIAALIHMSGWDFYSALRMQLMTSIIGSVSGLGVGLVLMAYNDKVMFLSPIVPTILPFSAGGFLYLALSIILPQLRIESAMLGFRQTAIVFFAAVLGIMLLAVV